MKNEYFIIDNKDTGKKVIMSTHEGEEGDKAFDIGDLSRGAFDYLGNWRLFLRHREYGVAYRFGVKSGKIESEKGLSAILVHFYLPITERGHTFIDEEKEFIEENLKALVRIAGQMWCMAPKNIGRIAISTLASPPDYMIKELEEILRRQKQ